MGTPKDTETNTDTRTHGHMDTRTHGHTDTRTHGQTDARTHGHTDTQKCAASCTASMTECKHKAVHNLAVPSELAHYDVVCVIVKPVPVEWRPLASGRNDIARTPDKELMVLKGAVGQARAKNTKRRRGGLTQYPTVYSRCPYGAHTMPVRCPYGARTRCPLGFSLRIRI